MVKLKKIFGIFILVFSIVIPLSVNTALAGDKKLEFVLISPTKMDPLWQEARQGMRDAAKMLGVNATFQFGEDDNAKTANFFEAAIASGVDGIGININNPNSYDKLIEKALKAGIPVIGFNTDDPEGADGNARLAFVGQDYFDAGYLVGKAIAAMNPKPKHVATYAEMPGLTYAVQRYGGVKKALDAAGISSEIVDCGVESSASILSRMEAYLHGHPETTHTVPLGSWVAAIATKAIEEMNLQGKVINAGFDIGDKVIDDLQKGKSAFVIDQQVYAQSYYTVIQLFNYITKGVQPFDMNTGMAIITADQIDEYIKYRK
jgi:simple sugar transport system substrate-binding protein